MPEVLMPELEIEEKTHKEDKTSSRNVSDELNDILLGRNFSTEEIRKFHYKLLNTINGKGEGLNSEALASALNSLALAGPSKKSFDVEIQTIAEMLRELIHGPNLYRQENGSKIHALIEFYEQYKMAELLSENDEIAA